MRRRSLLGVVVSLGIIAGCATVPEPVTLYCDGFEVGADFDRGGVGPLPATPTYSALAQAVSDVAVLASSLLQSVDAACSELALDFGADDASGERASTAHERVMLDCERAAEKIRASRASLREAKVAVWFARQACLADTAYQVACEATCRTDANCIERDSGERCEAGNVIGACDGSCSGECEGSKGGPIACDGACTGECDGACLDAGRPVKDFASGGRCATRCVGRCSATCTPQAGRQRCEGACRGVCDGTRLPGRCATPLEAPRCAGEADCHQACRASAYARATCPNVALAVTSDGAATESTVRKVRALERSLPAIFDVARGRGDDIRDAARRLERTARHVATSDELSGERAACGVVIARTGAVADENMRAASSAAKAVSAALDYATKP